MANTKSAAKRARQSVKRAAVNRRLKSQVKTARRRFDEAVATGDAAKARTAFNAAVSTMGKATKRGVVHQNKVGRVGGRMHAAMKKMAAAPEAEATA